jgi:predicted MPP superfamily phosphohydrolase
MTTAIAERSLAERLKNRIAVEEQFARTGRKLRHKPLLLRHERLWLRPLLKLSLQAAGLYSRGVRNALKPVVRELPLYFANLPAGLDGFQILHLSDLHIDGVDGLSDILEDVLSNLHPDVCVMTGDYRFEDDGPCGALFPKMRAITSSISAKYGTFAILGNHDASEIAFALEEMGVRMLINEAVEIRDGRTPLWLAGIDDPFDYRCDDIPGALSAVPSNAFKILLAHTPELFTQASGHSVDLYLCGHTHGGQIRLPKIGAVRQNADCPSEYAYGHWIHNGMQAYTSAGIGCSSLPVRFNCPPEIVLIELRPENKS